MEANHLLSRRNFYSLSYRDTRGNDIIRCINTASSSRTNPGESHFFFFLKTQFSAAKIYSKDTFCLGNISKRSKKIEKKEKKGRRKKRRKV